MKKNLLIAMCLLFSLIGYTQTRTITGTVYDGYDNSPLVGCTVNIHGTSDRTMTDIDGKFSLTIPIEGNHELKFSYIGYDTGSAIITDSRATYDTWMYERREYRSYARYIKRKPVTNVDPYQVKDIRIRLLNNYRNNGSYKPFENREIELLSRGIKLKTDKEGYATLKAATDSDQLKDVITGEVIMVAYVIDSVLHTYPEPVFSHLVTSSNDTIGVRYMRNDMPASYRGGYLNKLKNIKELGNNKFELTEARDEYKSIGYKIAFISYIDIGTVGKLPRLQTKYAQGRNGKWQGADKNEIFSWGPAVSNLEYNSKPYPYDRNGELVPFGEGNGIPANRYDSKDFFRTGISFGNSVNAKFSAFGKSVFSLKLGQSRNNSTIPNASKESYNASLFLENLRLATFQNEVGIMFKSSYGKLSQQGANLSSLLHSVFTTPVTFDNANGQSKPKDSWILPDGNIRSYAPLYEHNPYKLINELPDRDKNEDILAYIKTKRIFRKIETNAMISYDKQWNKKHSGSFENQVLPYRLSYRSLHSSNIIANADMIWRIKEQGTNMNAYLSYGFKNTTEKVNRNDQYRYSGLQYYSTEYNKLIRNAHDIRYGAKLNTSNQNFTLEVFNKHYFSNTAKSSDYLNLFPEFGFSWNMNEFISNTFNTYSYDRNFVLYGSVNRSVGESSLIYQNPAVLSTKLNAEDFRHHDVYREMYNYKGLKPETYLKSEVGLRYFSPDNRFSGEANVFYYNTHNYIAPIMEDGTNALLTNVGRLRNYGYYLSGKYLKQGYGNSLGFQIKLNFSQTKNRVSAVYGDNKFIPLAGFADIQTVFAENQPLGAIYGTSYLRNDKGQLLIDADGYPMVDKTLKKIGDPTPDFIMTLNPTFWWKNFTFSFVLEYNQGGDRWNGTQAVLDYYGMSENSEKNRDTQQYIFKGVDVAGNVNALPVDFYNPARPLSENRWVRYGTTGVGEEYIQDASFLRLSNVNVTYSIFHNRTNRLFKSMKVSGSAQNLFVISPYKGVDPSSLLFGYSSGHGLDLFNLPLTRSYSFSLTLEF